MALPTLHEQLQPCRVEQVLKMTIVGARKQMEEQNQFDIGFFCEVKGKFTFLITSASAARIHREADAPFWGPNL